MLEIERLYMYLIATGGAIASYLWGGWSTGIQALMVLVAIDYVTGIMASTIAGKLNSDRGYKGILRKFMIFLVVTLSYWCGKVVMGDGTYLRDGAITFYVINETLSIIENVGRSGVPIPDVVRQAIEVLKGKQKKKPTDDKDHHPKAG